MTLEEQTQAVRAAYRTIHNRIYSPEFRKRLNAVMTGKEKKWYETQLERIEAVTSVVENCLIAGELSRAVIYTAALNVLFNQIKAQVEKHILSLIEKNHLTK